MLEYELQEKYRVSERRASEALHFPRSTHRRQSIADDRTELQIRLRDLASSRVRYGYRRLHIILRRDGHNINHKLTYRLYREEDLALNRKNPKRHRSPAKKPLREPTTRIN